MSVAFRTIMYETAVHRTTLEGTICVCVNGPQAAWAVVALSSVGELHLAREGGGLLTGEQCALVKHFSPLDSGIRQT